MSIEVVSIPDMDDLFDLPIFLTTLLVFVVGHTAHSIIASKRRVRLALLHRDRYFSKLAQDFNKMDEEINQRWTSLKDKHDAIIAELKELGFTPAELDSIRLPDEDELKKTKAHLEDVHRQKKECEDELSKILKSVDLDNAPSLADLQKLIKDLENENRELEEQLGQEVTQSKSTCGMNERHLDQDILDFLEKHDYTTDSLNEIYEFLLEIQARQCDQRLDDYLSSLEQSSFKYASNLTELDVKRKEVELCLRRTRETYAEELSSFNESRIEYLFRITAAERELAALMERNQILEVIADNRRKEYEAKKNDPSQTS